MNNVQKANKKSARQRQAKCKATDPGSALIVLGSLRLRAFVFRGRGHARPRTRSSSSVLSPFLRLHGGDVLGG